MSVERFWGVSLHGKLPCFPCGKIRGNLSKGPVPGQCRGGHPRAIVKKGYLKDIIGLPANLFYGTGLPVYVLVLDKENAHARKGVFMIDASKGFLKDGNKNRLRAQDMHKVVDAFNHSVEIAGYSRLVPLSEIADPKIFKTYPRIFKAASQAATWTRLTPTGRCCRVCGPSSWPTTGPSRPGLTAGRPRTRRPSSVLPSATTRRS